MLICLLSFMYAHFMWSVNEKDHSFWLKFGGNTYLKKTKDFHISHTYPPLIISRQIAKKKVKG